MVWLILMCVALFAIFYAFPGLGAGNAKKEDKRSEDIEPIWEDGEITGYYIDDKKD